MHSFVYIFVSHYYIPAQIDIAVLHVFVLWCFLRMVWDIFMLAADRDWPDVS